MRSSKLAILLTCHNRREKTISCLKALYSASLPANVLFDVYLVDDGSTDNTTEAVNRQFASVNVIIGSGDLFWNQGMRLAWDNAIKNGQYDFFLWLNDDTIINKNAIVELFEIHDEVLEIRKQNAIVTGACQSTPDLNEFSYGGKTEKGPVIPNGMLQQCKYINGNIVLIPKIVFEKLGNLSSEYSHTMGDFDYGLRALQNGFYCYTTKKYIAVCPTNQGTPAWCNPHLPVKKRWQLLHSPKGLNVKEYIKFRQKFWGWRWIIYAVKAYAKSLFPRLYKILLNN